MKLNLGKPVITSHQYYALPLSIISSEPRLCSWLYNEFIQWYTFRNREDDRIHVRLYNNKNELFIYEPLEEVLVTPKQLVDGSNIIDVFRSFLNSGQYVYDFVDHYYIKAFGCNKHYMHDVLIYGYDNSLQVLHAYAYLGSKLAKFEIPYSEYVAAYNSDYQKSQWHCTVLYRKKEMNFYPNVNRIGNHIADYLASINTFQREAPLSVDLYNGGGDHD